MKQMEPVLESGIGFLKKSDSGQESRRIVLALVMFLSKTFTLYNLMYILQREFFDEGHEIKSQFELCCSLRYFF